MTTDARALILAELAALDELATKLARHAHAAGLPQLRADAEMIRAITGGAFVDLNLDGEPTARPAQGS